MKKLKRALAIIAISFSSIAASCSGAVHAEESHVDLGRSSSVSR
jgi:hypothetical protein